MAWDATLPANSTKIRLYPSVLQANFSAIETGDSTLQYDALNIQEQGSNPSRIDDCMIIYSKQDPSGETELFVLDDQNPANSIQMTEVGFLGSQSTSIGMQDFTFDAGTTTYDNKNIVNTWGIFDATVSSQTVYGATVSKLAGTGKYRVTFDTARSAATYAAVVTVTTPGSLARAVLNNVGTASFDIETYSGNTAFNLPCSFLVSGTI